MSASSSLTPSSSAHSSVSKSNQKCIDDLMSLNEWSYDDLMRYGQYHMENFGNDSNIAGSTESHKNFQGTIYLRRLLRLSKYVYTIASTVNPGDHNDISPEYLTCYMAKNKALDFLHIMGTSMNNANLIIKTVATNEVIYEIGDTYNMNQYAFSQKLPNEVMSKVTCLINDIQNPITLVQITNKMTTCDSHCILSCLLTYFSQFADSEVNWSIKKLLEFGRYHLKCADEDPADIGFTDIESLSGKYMHQMQQLNNYIFTTSSTNNPHLGVNNRLTVNGYLQLKTAKKLCTYLFSKHINYLLKVVKNWKLLEIYATGTVIEDDYESIGEWDNCMKNELPRCTDSKLNLLINVNDNPLVYISIIHNTLDKDLYEILLEYFQYE